MQHSGLDRVGHAVKHLELEITAVDTEPIGLSQHAGDAAHVVRPEGAVQHISVLQQREGEVFEIGIRLRLVREHRRRPMPLLRGDCLVIPISSFDQPDGNAAPMLARPMDHRVQIGFAILQIGLHGQAARRRGGELRLGENLFEQTQRQFLERVALHVEIDERAELLGAAKNRPESR